MMLEREPITDPNVAAYYVTHGGMRLVVEPARDPAQRRPLLGVLAALLGAGAPLPVAEHAAEPRPVRADPPLEPGSCVRQGHVIFATPEFRQRMEVHLNAFRDDARAGKWVGAPADGAR